MSIVALVDCNNFYASCERLFQPKLRHTPIVVLSNNDGCVIARSNEAKAFGIGMGDPVFKCQYLLTRHAIKVFSANFALYGDMSRRVMQTLAQFTPKLEVYSIDEAFLDLGHLPPEQIIPHARMIRETVLRWTGVPVSIGIAPTKTLAKLANKLAKKEKAANGVYRFFATPDEDALLAEIPAIDLWGIGPAWARFLLQHKLPSVRHVKYCDPFWLRKALNIVAQRIVMELRGQACITLEEITQPRQNICCSRSFGRAMTEQSQVREAVTRFVCRAAEKLRSQKSLATQLQVFVHADWFTNREYTNAAGWRLPEPTDDSLLLSQYAGELLSSIFRAGHNYKKAGVLLMGLVGRNARQLTFDTDLAEIDRRARLMRAMDRVNRDWGNETLRLAASGIARVWKMKQGRLSPRYTTRWKDLVAVSTGSRAPVQPL